MEMFPDLKQNEVALLRAEKKTGHVLDESFLLALNDSQKVYTIFDSFDEARIFAQGIIDSNNDIEIVIYSSSNEVLYYSNE
ncbi:MAG: hypothetical protein J7599_13795 [Niabella sp.]|nr:hypothetical protein [Niabella sp.]